MKKCNFHRIFHGLISLSSSRIMSLLKKLSYRKVLGSSNGFTIIELLVVIVIIAILSTITFVSYTGITQKAAAATLQSDLKNASTGIALYNANNDIYPADLAAAQAANLLPSSNNTTYQYTLTDNNYCLSVTSTKAGNYSYHFSSLVGTIEDGVCEGHIASGAPATANVEILVVAGGGGGGKYLGGGGAGGGVVYSAKKTIILKDYIIIVGQGGAAGSVAVGGTGGDSRFDDITALGGGGGGGYDGAYRISTVGGSGGGATGLNGYFGAAAAQTDSGGGIGYGSAGGNGVSYNAGGGGGALAVGGNGNSGGSGFGELDIFQVFLDYLKNMVVEVPGVPILVVSAVSLAVAAQAV